MKYSQLVEKYRAGQLAESDVQDVDAMDLLKVRQEAGDGLVHHALDTDAAFYSEDPDETFAKGDKGRVPYVMVSDQLIPPFSDRVVPGAWALKEFKQRGSTLLYDHNIEESRPPIGRMHDVRTKQSIRRHGKDFVAMTGDAEFVPEGSFAFADLVGQLVREGFLRGGSVGFDVEKARPANEDEIEELGMKPYSLVIEKANLIEFSVTPLGRDPHALTLSRFGAEDSLEGRLAQFAAEGVYDADVVGALREDVLSRAGKKTRTQVAVAKPAGEGPAKGGIVNAVEAVLCAEPDHRETVIPLPNGQRIPVLDSTTSASNQGVTFSFPDPDPARDARIAELEAEVAQLRAENEELRSQDFYDALFDACDSGDEREDHSESAGGGDSEDLFDLAVNAGLYDPNAV